MKTKTLTIVALSIIGFLNQLNAQCSKQTTLNEDFSNPTDQVGGGGLKMPTCWKSITAGAGSNFHAIN